MSNYDNFVFYGSLRETLEGFAEDFGKEYAQEALWNLMLSGTAGDMETTKKSIISWINGSCMDNINSAKDRYSKAVENGKKGGRPTEISTEEIMQMKKDGMTNKQIAEKLGCSIKNVEKRITTYNKAHPTNPTNLDIDIDIDIDIDNDIDNEKDKEKEKDVEIETDSSASSNSDSNTNTTMNVNVNTIDTDIAIAIIDMFKNKTKYKDIQNKIKTDFDIDISFDDIKYVIDNKNSYIALAEKEKEAKRDNYFKQVEYNYIPDVVEKLTARGINTTCDEVKTAYDKVQNSNLCSKWNIRELTEDCYLNGSFIGDTKTLTLSEYTDKIIKFKDSMFGY